MYSFKPVPTLVTVLGMWSVGGIAECWGTSGAKGKAALGNVKPESC